VRKNLQKCFFLLNKITLFRKLDLLPPSGKKWRTETLAVEPLVELASDLFTWRRKKIQLPKRCNFIVIYTMDKVHKTLLQIVRDLRFSRCVVFFTVYLYCGCMHAIVRLTSSDFEVNSEKSVTSMAGFEHPILLSKPSSYRHHHTPSISTSLVLATDARVQPAPSCCLYISYKLILKWGTSISWS
jgi:hypothetical protein